LPDGAGLEPLFHQVGAAALGALFRYRFGPRHELAVRIPVAAVESLALARTTLGDLAFRALRAFHPDGLLLDVLARGVVAARREFAEAAALQHQVVAALRALLVE